MESSGPAETIVVAGDHPLAADVTALLQRHLAFTHASSPPDDVHALDVPALVEPSITFVSARRAGALLGIGALKQLDSEHVEVKSMHTATEARGQGIGRLVLDHLLEVARAAGAHRVSLETGTQEVFAPARSLYTTAGFVPCEPFADYRPSPQSTFLTRDL